MDKDFEGWVAGTIQESLLLNALRTSPETPYLVIRDVIRAVFDEGKKVGFDERDRLDAL